MAKFRARGNAEVASPQPRVFIGSSSEGRQVADAIQVHLQDDFAPNVWSQGIFKLTTPFLRSLLIELNRAEYAILVCTPDDVSTSRGKRSFVPRDNVVFELGLFIGALGPERTFFVLPKNVSLKLPTDLSGYEPARYTEPVDDDYVQALAATCTLIKKDIRDKRKAEESASKRLNFGLQEYSHSIRDREVQFRKIISDAGQEVLVTGTALRNITTNSWGVIRKAIDRCNVSILMLDPNLRDHAEQREAMEVVYRPGVLEEAANTLRRIQELAAGLPKGRRGKLRLYLSKSFMPIAATVADPASPSGRMVVEVIGGSTVEDEYFGRPRYVLQSFGMQDAMFRGYWRVLQTMLSPSRSRLVNEW